MFINFINSQKISAKRRKITKKIIWFSIRPNLKERGKQEHCSPRRCKIDDINCSYSVCQHHFTCMCLIHVPVLSLHLQIPSCFYKLTCRFNLLFRWFWIIIRNILKNVHQHQIFCNSANPNFKYFSHLCCCCKTVVIVFTAVPIDPTCCRSDLQMLWSKV